MTRKEEIARASKDHHLKHYPNFTFGEYVSFIDGAKWADRTMIGRACEWLERNYHATPMGGYYYLPEDCIEQFKQAMKGE